MSVSILSEQEGQSLKTWIRPRIRISEVILAGRMSVWRNRPEGCWQESRNSNVEHTHERRGDEMTTQTRYVFYRLYHSAMHGSSTPVWQVEERYCNTKDDYDAEMSDPITSLYCYGNRDTAEQAQKAMNETMYSTLQSFHAKPRPVVSTYFPATEFNRLKRK